jgi:hypothetical protein
LRGTYFTATELPVYREAEQEAARHAGEAERLNAIELKSRAASHGSRGRTRRLFNLSENRSTV